MDNRVVSDVVAQLCDYCGEDIFTPEVEVAPKSARAIAGHTGNVLRAEPVSVGEQVQGPAPTMMTSNR